MNLKDSIAARILCLVLAVLMIGGTAVYAILELFVG